MNKENGYVVNCYLGLGGDKRLVSELGKPTLNGCAIITLEEYQKLSGKDFSDTIAKAKVFDKQNG